MVYMPAARPEREMFLHFPKPLSCGRDPSIYSSSCDSTWELCPHSSLTFEPSRFQVEPTSLTMSSILAHTKQVEPILGDTNKMEAVRNI